MKKFFKLWTILFVFIFAACASSKPVKVSKGDKALPLNKEVLSGALNNGMTYYILKNDKPYNRISLRLVVKVGSIAENENQLGIAHLIEHMAFNGTEHFEKNSLIDYAELIGMDFGAEVNAYTSFEETVYMLEVPADDPSFLETALLIFKDWASAVSFDQEELDKERGVVTEEWRSRLGLNGRIVDAILPFELADSEYVGKLPIGSMDVIANVTREELIDFYKQWYRPENISIVVTGCVEAKSVQELIKSTMKDIPASAKKVSPVRGYVPVRTEKDALIFSDPEMPYAQVQLLAKDENYRPIKTEEDLKSRYLTSFANDVFNSRLAETIANPQTAWLSAYPVNYHETNTSVFNGVLFVPKDDCFTEAFKQMIEEIDRLLLFGVTQSEFDREKDSIIAKEKSWYDKKETISSADRAEELVRHSLTGEAYLADDDYYKIASRLINSITIEDVNNKINELFQGRGSLCMIYAPTTLAASLPSKKEILDLWENYQSESLAEYEDIVAEGELMARPSEKADIESKRRISNLGVTEYILSNGARIIVRNAPNEKSRINMRIVSKGGCALVSDQDWMSCYFSTTYAMYSGLNGLDINQLQKYLSDKNVNLNMEINEHEETITGFSSPDQLECLLQLATLLLSKPQFTDQGWYFTQLVVDQQARVYGVQPGDYFYSKILEFLFNDSVRHTPISPEKATMLNQKDAERLYRERYSNAADFTFIFYGDINEKELIELCRYYIGSLKGDPKALEETKYEPLNFPKGINEKTYKKGQEKQGQVFIAFGGDLPAAENSNEYLKDEAMLLQLQALVDIKLREIIREDKSGTYGVSVYASMHGRKKERSYDFYIDFGCEPSREKELAAEVLAVIEDLRNKPVDKIYIDKINETYRRSYEANQQDADWCIFMIEEIEAFNTYPVTALDEYDKVPSWTTAESMQETARKYLNTQNYFCAFLEPEK